MTKMQQMQCQLSLQVLILNHAYIRRRDFRSGIVHNAGATFKLFTGEWKELHENHFIYDLSKFVNISMITMLH